VLSSINFQDDLLLSADEITDIRANRELSGELMTIDLPITNAIPQDPLRVGLIDAQPPCDSDHLPIWTAHDMPLTRIASFDAMRPLPVRTGRG
jgi:hypothetical protein